MVVKDRNGRRICQRILHNPDGSWDVTVWLGGANGFASEVRRYTYKTREQARRSDITHQLGQHGRID
jgi:hypothetical protein